MRDDYGAAQHRTADCAEAARGVRLRSSMKNLKASEKLALLIALAVVVAGGAGAVALVSSVASSHPAAKVRLVDHHCSASKTGSVIVNAQLANDGHTGQVQASGYALLASGRIVNADGWQYEHSITAGSSDFFVGDVPVPSGALVTGCGVLVGSRYMGDGSP